MYLLDCFLTAAGMATALTAFTTTHRVIDRIHDNTAVAGTATEPTAATGLTTNLEVVLRIRNNTHGCTASLENHTHLAAGHLDNCILVVTRHKLGIGTGTADHLGTLARTELNVVNQRTERNLSERERVSNFGSCTFTGHDGLSDLQTLGGENVTLLTVSVEHQSNTRATIGVVLDSLYNSRNAVLVSLEVDKAV